MKRLKYQDLLDNYTDNFIKSVNSGECKAFDEGSLFGWFLDRQQIVEATVDAFMFHALSNVSTQEISVLSRIAMIMGERYGNWNRIDAAKWAFFLDVWVNLQRRTR